MRLSELCPQQLHRHAKLFGVHQTGPILIPIPEYVDWGSAGSADQVYELILQVMGSVAVGIGMVWSWYGVGTGLAWGWYGVDMGLVWGWYGVGMGLSWGWHGVGMVLTWA